MKRNTRRYAKRQLTWFGGLEGVRWLDMERADATVQAEFARAFWTPSQGGAMPPQGKEQNQA